MFDARSLIDMMMRGAAPPAAQQGGGGLGPLGDVLGQVLGGGSGAAGGAAGQHRSGGAGGLEELLRNVMQGAGGAGGAAAGGGLGDLLGGAVRNMTAGGAGPAGSSGGTAGGGLGGLDELLRKIQGAGGQSGAPATPAGGATGAAGSLLDVLGQILAQAGQGVKEGAQRADDATGASGRMREAVGQATGQSPDELLAKLKELIANNQLGAGAALGGLGALVLGTRTGRSLATSAAKLGALALIGGLAYKAYQNYSQGRPPLSTASGLTHEAAPIGSGYEEQAVSQEAALLYVRAMIAAAAADGRLSADEQQKIIGGLRNAGLDREAEEFLAAEINNPASVEELAGAVRSQEEAVQLYTAARIAIDPDTRAEQQFLAALAGQLGIDGNLVAHIDAAARAASQPG